MSIPPPAPAGTSTHRHRTSSLSRDRLAAWAFTLYLGAAAGYILLGPPAQGLWFIYDEWSFILADDSFSDSLLRSHNGHWVALPYLIYQALFRVFGLTTYLPYLTVAVAVHAGVVILLRVIMRRSGVGAWTATILATALILFAPGGYNILFAFQITLTGALGLGLLQIVVVDSALAPPVRAVLGAGLGILAVMTSGLGVVLVAGAGGLAMFRRRWAESLAQVVPAVAALVLWRLLAPPATPPQQRAPGTLPTWVWHQFVDVAGTLLAPTTALGILILIAAVSGWVFRSTGLPGIPRPGHGAAPRGTAVPVTMLAVALMFTSLIWITRGTPGDTLPSRFLYVSAALILPAVGIGLYEVASRWRFGWLCLVPVVALFPVNASQLNLDNSPMYRGSLPLSTAERLHALYPAIAASPLARQVPRGTDPDGIGDKSLLGPITPSTVGDLLDLRSKGMLPDGNGADDTTRALVRFNLALNYSPGPPDGKALRCEWVSPGADLRIRPPVGQILTLRTESTDSMITFRLLAGDGVPEFSDQVLVRGRPAAAPPTSIRASLPHLRLVLSVEPGMPRVRVCRY